jgi:hypothetical protein
MMIATTDNEARRTSPLAYWRYGHDYLRIAHTLCRQHRIPCTEAQVAYHAAAQGLEFSLKAFLRTRGETVADLRAEIGHSLLKALARSEAQGLPPIPGPWRGPVAEIALCYQDTQFLYLTTPEGAFPELDPLIGAGIFVLDSIAPDVARHFVVHLGGDATPPAETFIRRLRADLSATFDIAAVANDEDGGLAHPFPVESHGGGRLYA